MGYYVCLKTVILKRRFI